MTSNWNTEEEKKSLLYFLEDAGRAKPSQWITFTKLPSEGLQKDTKIQLLNNATELNIPVSERMYGEKCIDKVWLVQTLYIILTFNENQ